MPFDFKFALWVFVVVALSLGGISGFIYLMCTGHFVWAVLVAAGVVSVLAGFDV